MRWLDSDQPTLWHERSLQFVELLRGDLAGARLNVLKNVLLFDKQQTEPEVRYRPQSGRLSEGPPEGPSVR